MLCSTDYKIRTVGRNYTNMVAYGYGNGRISAKGKYKGQSRDTKLGTLDDAKVRGNPTLQNRLREENSK
jgi:hypothetical protein